MAWAPDYVELDELKNYLRIPLDDTQDDDELALYITAASRAVDEHTNRQFGKTEAPATRTYTGGAGQVWYNGTRGVWVVEIDDLMSAAGLAVTVTDVGTVTDYALEPLNAAADGMPWTSLVIATASSVQPSASYPTYLSVEVAANVWGWTATPAAAKLATRLQASRFSIRRESPFGVAGSPEQGNELRLLSKLDPDVAVALKRYRRPRAVG